MKQNSVRLAICAALLLSLCLCVYLCVVTALAHDLPVLMYHNIVEDGQECNSMTVTVSRFREDMQWLMDHGYTFVLPSQLASGEALPQRPVMVTFDDGYRSNYDLLFPILQEMDVKVALALVVSMPDARLASDFLSWDMCREMSQSGLVEFGSHTYDLHNFDERGGSYVLGGVNGIGRLTDETQSEYEARVWTDLQSSVDAIQRELSTDVVYFAYPFGVTDSWADDYIQSHFSVTTLTKAGISDLNRGTYGLKRCTITMDDGARNFLEP